MIFCSILLKESGFHKSYEQPPEVPPFTERQSKVKKKNIKSGDGFTGLAEAITTMINRVAPTAEKEKEEQSVTCTGTNTKVV